jgi:hypothetical protein
MTDQRAPISGDELWRTFEQVKNWGRWGGDDEAGALNYLTPDTSGTRRRSCVMV